MSATVNADGPILITTQHGQNHFESFHAWLQTLPEVPYRFAVAVVRYGLSQMGVILEGVQFSADHTKLILVKTGSDRAANGRLARTLGPTLPT